MKALLVLSFILGFTVSVNGQARLPFEEIIMSADSILLVSHETTIDGYVSKEDLPGEPPKLDILPPRLLNEGRLSRAIIKQQKTLSVKERRELLLALQVPKGLRRYTPSKCYVPHHAVLMFAKGKVSYIEICFHCERANFSEGGEEHMTVLNWAKTAAFFRKMGLTFMLPKG